MHIRILKHVLVAVALPIAGCEALDQPGSNYDWSVDRVGFCHATLFPSDDWLLSAPPGARVTLSNAGGNATHVIYFDDPSETTKSLGPVRFTGRVGDDVWRVDGCDLFPLRDDTGTASPRTIKQ